MTGETLVHLAVSAQDSYKLSVLLKAGASVTHSSTLARTPLDKAYMTDVDPAIIRLLIKVTTFSQVSILTKNIFFF